MGEVKLKFSWIRFVTEVGLLHYEERKFEKTVAIIENYTLIFNCKCPTFFDDVHFGDIG